MEVISIERSTYEELLTSFNNFVNQMKVMAGRGTDKRLGEWLDNQDVCQILNISPRTFLLRQAAKPSGRRSAKMERWHTLKSSIRLIRSIRETISWLRFRNLTPSPILPILRYPHFRTSSFFPVLPL